jgi:hypothetical protein
MRTLTGPAGNTAPTINQVLINSTSLNNQTIENITCWINATDGDAETINAYVRWFNNSIEWPDYTDIRTASIGDNVFTLGASVFSPNTSKLDNWTCMVQIDDGNENATAFINASLIVNNTDPTVAYTELNSSELNNLTNESLTFWFKMTDADNETQFTIHYRWFNDSFEEFNLSNKINISLDILTNISAVPPSNTTKNENWTIMIAYYDGTVNSSYTNYSLIINDSKPTIHEITLNGSTESITASDNLTLYINSTDIDGDTITAYILWYRNVSGATAMVVNNTLNMSMIMTDNTLLLAGNITSANTTEGENWTAQVTIGDATNNNSLENRSVRIASGNAAPTINEVILNSSALLNQSDENLTCWVNATDTDADTINAYVRWFNQTTEVGTHSDIRTASIDDNVFTLIDTIYYPNTTRDLNWTCMVQIDDGTENATAFINSTPLNITNTPPPAVKQDYPYWNSSITNRTTHFNWTGVGDIDNDSITYTLFIERINCGDQNSNCFTSEVRVTDITTTSYTISDILDVDSRYNWTINATDGRKNVTNADEFNFTVSSLVSITLVNGTVAFGTLDNGVINDTENDDPTPILIENNGNVFTNITIYSSDWLWDSATAGINTSYWEYKADNYTGGRDAFNWTGSNTTFINMTDKEEQVIRGLNWSDINDTVEIEINITVPDDELAGTKSGEMTITARWYTDKE